MQIPRAIRPELPDAHQARYRDTAWADTKAIAGNRVLVVLLGLIALAATEATTFLSSGELSITERIILAALAAGAIIVVLPLIYLATFIAAPYRQRAFLAAENASLMLEAADEEEHAQAERQYAAALRAVDVLQQNPELVPLGLAWIRATRELVRDTFGELEAARLESRATLETRSHRLDEIADLLRDGERHAPSQSWTKHVKLVGTFTDRLGEVYDAGEQLRADLLGKDQSIGPGQVDDWLDELHKVLALMPGFDRFTYNSDPVVATMFATYEGINDPQINRALTLLDRRLPYMSNIIYPLSAYHRVCAL